jgi:hypothetical protein
MFRTRNWYSTLYETKTRLKYVCLANKVVCVQSDLNTEPLNYNKNEQITEKTAILAVAIQHKQSNTAVMWTMVLTITLYSLTTLFSFEYKNLHISLPIPVVLGVSSEWKYRNIRLNNIIRLVAKSV